MAYANFAPSGSAGQPLFQGRFGQSHLAILAHSELSDLDTRVYGILAAHRNVKTGKAWPSRKTLAALAGVHPDSISRSTAKLESLGYIVKVRRGGPGNKITYLFPLLDARAAERQATAPKASAPAPQASTSSSPAKPEPRKRKARAPVCSDATDRPTGPDTIERDFRETKTHPKPLPVPPAIEEPAGPPCGEFFGPQLPDLEHELIPQEIHQPNEIGLQATRAPEPIQPLALAFPEALALNLCAQIARMLVGIPLVDAQALVDELAFNSRCHVIHKPGGYMRRLIAEYRAGRFVPEVAQFERQRRERIADNERSRRMAERQHLEALAKGQLPAPPPPPIRERTDEEVATGLEAIAAMRAGLGRKPH